MVLQDGHAISSSSRPPRRLREGTVAAAGASGRAAHRALFFALAAILLAVASAAAGIPQETARGKSLSVLTQNAYVGASIERVMAVDPNDPEALLTAVTTTYYELLASRPNLRMIGIANRIADRRPDIVALQEMYTLRRQSPGDLIYGGTVPATEVVVDFTPSLLAALAARGLHYRVAVTSTETDVELPMYNLLTGMIDDARLTDHEVILVRSDVPPNQLRIWSRQSGHFETHLTLPLGIEILQGWCSIDVTVRGERFRFINAHLQDESFPDIQYAQALELLAGPAETQWPVLMAGDFNADPLGRNGTFSYPALLNGGFTDAWTEVRPEDPGLTWGHDALLADPGVELSWRIDLVLFRGPIFDPRRIETIDTRLRLLLPPLWPSDHAGVAAEFRLR